METGFGMSAQVVTQKVCDLTSKNSDIKRKGLVQIKPIKDDSIRIPSATFHSSRDPKTGLFYGIPVAKNGDGSIRFRKMTMTGNRFFNLEVEQDAIDFYIFRHAPFMENTPCPSPGFKPIFKIEDLEAESDMKLEKAAMGADLTQLILNMKESDLRHWGILYGIDPLQNTPQMIRVQLIENSVSDPKKMKERFENKERTILETLFKRAMRTGVVTHSLDKGYSFKNGIAMGNNEQAAIDKLMIDKDFSVNVESEVILVEKDYAGKERVDAKKSSKKK